VRIWKKEEGFISKVRSTRGFGDWKEKREVKAAPL